MAFDYTPSALATLVTITTYGSWLRGDRRGWVDRTGLVHTAAPALESLDRRRLKHSPFLFQESELLDIGRMIGESLHDRLQVKLLAMSLDRWHVHFVAGPTAHSIGQVVKCVKDAVRYGLRPGRPIWTARYDKRWCFDHPSMLARIRYVERHNERVGWESRPWYFLAECDAMK